MNQGSPARLITGQTLSFHDDPRSVGKRAACDYHTHGALVTSADGRILWHGDRTEVPSVYASLPVDDHGARLVCAGFIDTHVHFPQYRMLAAPGTDLLDWLDRFTFAEEARYGERAHAEAASEQFLDRLLAHGTTAALAFSSVHEGACDALFSAAEARGMALVTGKTLMDCNAPPAVLDTAEGGARESRRLAEIWHGRGRLRYAITVRFVLTSTEAQLEAAGALCRQFPDCVMQSHLSENRAEVELVRQRFAWARDYVHVYERFGLLGQRSLFAHGIHLSESECQRLHEAGAAVIHCPTSNTFLGSGLFDIGRLEKPDRPVGLGLATDVGGGTSFSMLQTMGEAHKVAKLNGHWLAGHDGFYMATLGNARRLGLADEIGSLTPGKWADLVVLDPAATPVLASRHELNDSLEDLLFSLMILGDDRAVNAVYVRGRAVR